MQCCEQTAALLFRISALYHLVHVFITYDIFLEQEVDYVLRISDTTNDCRMQLLELEFQNSVRLYNINSFFLL